MINKELHDSIVEQNRSLTAAVASMSKTISALTKEIESLKAHLLKDSDDKEKMLAKLNGLAKIAMPKKLEKVTPKRSSSIIAPTPKERGNNGAKRKVLDIEEVITDVYPDSSFDKDSARLIASQDVIRYEFTPAKLIKHIYRIHKYSMAGEIIQGKAPMTPLLNSSYSSSFIAFLIQKRYVYGMPVERIMCYLNEIGVDITKSCLHGLLSKTAGLLDRLGPVLKGAILESRYIHFDETYHQVLDKKLKGRSRKAYFWAAQSHESKLMQFFYKEGSRGSDVFKEYLPTTYKGAIQTDGYACYKVVEGWKYMNTTRLGCVQHNKRKFLDIENDPDAKRIIDLYNKFYQIRKTKPTKEWVALSLKVYDKLEEELRKIERDPKHIPNKKLISAVRYCLNELESIYNIITQTEYDLDNNAIERPMRYISISRKNSMFCGSNKGAERSALIYSLAISCRLNKVNSFVYFNDIIMRLAQLPPTAGDDILREILPDKWANRE